MNLQIVLLILALACAAGWFFQWNKTQKAVTLCKKAIPNVRGWHTEIFGKELSPELSMYLRLSQKNVLYVIASLTIPGYGHAKIVDPLLPEEIGPIIENLPKELRSRFVSLVIHHKPKDLFKIIDFMRPVFLCEEENKELVETLVLKAIYKALPEPLHSGPLDEGILKARREIFKELNEIFKNASHLTNIHREIKDGLDFCRVKQVSA